MVFGTEHLRTSVAKGLEIMEALRGWTSGLAVPYYVIDAPGGGGKIPVLPQYVVKLSDDEVILRNYAGKIFKYSQPNLNGKMQVEEILEDFAELL
jgi:lysine 2,3-aminomutase